MIKKFGEDSKCMGCGNPNPVDFVSVHCHGYIWLFCDLKCLRERLNTNYNTLGDVEGETLDIADPSIHPGDVKK